MYHSGWYSYPIDGIHITIDDFPDCVGNQVEEAEGECEDCTFFSPNNCKLRRNPILRIEISDILNLYRENRDQYLKKIDTIADTIRLELRAHGRPLHYSVIARIVTTRHANLDATENLIYTAICSHPELFERVNEGVYKVRN